MIRAGAATAAVEVPVGTPMAGYAARPGPSTGVHDPLTVRALVVDEVGFVVVDCCALTEVTCAEVRAAAGLDEVFVSATHTHSGPCLTPGRVGGADEGVLAEVVAAARTVVAEARARAVPCAVTFAEATGLGVAKNRRHPGRTIDPPLQVIGFEGPDGVVAVFVTYPCHPVVLDAANRLISADYPGVIRQTVEAAHPGAICIFATGCAGDVNDGHPAEASYTSEASDHRTFAAVDRIGERLGRAAVEALGAAAQVVTAARATARTAPVTLALATLQPESVAAERDGWRRQADRVPPSQRAVYDIWGDWADSWLASYGTHPTSWEGRVGLTRVGAVTIVTLPCEPFLGVAEAIRADLPGAVVLGYTDGVVGYLPTADEYPYGGYEVVDSHRYYGMPAPFEIGSAERLVEAVRTLARA
jgi:hypothetical protein